MRVDEERERDGENGHELFMNASMKGGKAVGVGWQRHSTAVSRGGRHQNSSFLFLNLSS